MDVQQNAKKRKRRSRFTSNEEPKTSADDHEPNKIVDEPPSDGHKKSPPPAAVDNLRKRVAQSLATKTNGAEPEKHLDVNIKKRRRLDRFQFTKTSEEEKVNENGKAPTKLDVATVSTQTQRKSSGSGKSRWGAPVVPKPSNTSKIDLKAIPTGPAPTLRINRTVAQKRKVASILRISESDLLETDPDLNPYHDNSIKNAVRKRDARALSFIPQGEVAAKAEVTRQKATVDARRAEYKNQLKQDVASASELPVLPPLTEDLKLPDHKKDEVPDCEWWDLPFIEKSDETETKDNNAMEDDNEIVDGIRLRTERITHYIHHPLPILKASEKPSPPVIPLKLTKKETKRLRRQRRKEEQLEKQEKIAIGLLPPPKPRVKLSNLMRVLANEATADPTKIEAEVRAQVEERQQKHQEANEARKLSKEERKQKAIGKVEKDKEQGLYAIVFRIADLSNPALRFKVSVNAKQLLMTGTMVLFENCNVVVAEGGAKAIRRYKKLMLRRINWEESVKESTQNEEKNSAPDISQTNTSNQDKNIPMCALVWEGAITSPSFEEFRQVTLHTERLCRKHFREHHVGHYWDLCIQATPIGNKSLVQDKID